MIYLFVIPVGALVFVTISNILQTTTISAQWPDYEILEYQNSNYGNITLLQREQQLHLLNNGSPVAVAPNPDAAQNEIIAHVPLLMHQNPVHIMFIGNGISGILYEILKHPIQRVDYAEMDPLILDITRHYLPMYLVPDDKRLSIHKTDGRIFLKNATESYDIIYLNLPPPESLEINRFYTSEFFRLCKNRIKKSGVLVFVLPASESYFTEELGRMHQSILNAADEFFSENFVILNTSAIIFLSDSQDNLNHSVDFIIEQSKKRAIQTQTINNANLRFRLNPVYRQWYLQQIGYNDRNEKNSVFHPIAVFHSLLYWNAQHAPFLNKFFEVLRKIPISVLIISPIFLFLPVFILKKKSNQVLSVLLPIGLTGYAGMGTNVILVLLFQSLYGYIYQWIGLIATAFMLGISTGAFIIIKYSFHDNIRRIFFLSELAWISQIFFTLVFFYIMESGVMPETVFKIIILFLAGTAGILVGGQFPLAITILKSGMRDVRAAGITYAADLSGGWFGGITIAIYLIPLFGVWSTCLLLLILKLTSMSIVMHYRHTATGE